MDGLDAWIYRWIDGLNESMDRWIRWMGGLDGMMDGQMDLWPDGFDWMDEYMDWMDGQTDCMDGRTHGQTR